jgi:hypothetical protein
VGGGVVCIYVGSTLMRSPVGAAGS